MADISAFNLPDGSSYNLKDAVARAKSFYGTCATAQGTAAKVVVCPEFTAANLVAGTVLYVDFTAANTASNPTLNINSTGAKDIYRYGTTRPSTSAASSWNAGSIVCMIYDGAAWNLEGWLNTTYSSMTVSEIDAGTGTTARTITPARLKHAVETWSTGEVNVQSDWNETDSTSDAYILNKPDILDPNIIDAYARSSSLATELAADWLSQTGAMGGTAITPEENKIYRLLNNSVHYLKGMVFRWTGTAYEPFISYPVADWNQSDSTQPDYIQNKPTLLTPLEGSTANTTPTQVMTAVGEGRPVSISITDNSYGLLTFNTFNSSWAMNMVVANMLFDYNSAQYIYTLIGECANDTWSTSVATLAKSSDIPTVPTNVSAFTNDAGYLTSYTETDPTVPAWAKAGTKPSYTASEVGALATTGGEVTGDITLKADAAANSKCLIFQRGTLSDNYNDWMIQDRGGYLYFDERGSGSSAWTNRVMFNTTGNVSATSFTGSGASLTNLNASNLESGTVPSARLDLSGIRQLPAVSSADNGKVLRVVNGAWSAVELQSANGVSF